MSVMRQLIASGLAVTARLHGESLTLRGSAVTGVVNRTVGTSKPGAPVDFTMKPGSLITLSVPFAFLPREGEVIEDENGQKHRIQEATWKDVCWELRCTTSLR